MKKLFISLSILLYASQIFAQYPTDDSYIGLIGGVNVSNNLISNPSLSGYSIKYKPGFAGGLYYNIPLSGKFSFQPELLYTQMGSQLESTEDQSLNAKLEFDYVSLPILVKFSPINKLAIFAGPQVNLITSAKINYQSGEDVDEIGQLKNLDPEATVGVEYWITKNIGVYARGMMGFININEKDPGLWFNEQMLTSDISNYAFQAGITIGFPAAENTSEIDTSEKSAAEIIDTDGDSVIDKIDKCPTLFGSRDNLGCPDMILYYSNTDAVLDSTDMLNLDKVAAFLMDNPKLKIIIEAHTGTSGDSIYNQAASQRRAELSLDYLASKGISKKRMKAVGYGEQYAIGNDDTDITGKSWSKRVFIRIARK